MKKIRLILFRLKQKLKKINSRQNYRVSSTKSVNHWKNGRETKNN